MSSRDGLWGFIRFFIGNRDWSGIWMRRNYLPRNVWKYSRKKGNKWRDPRKNGELASIFLRLRRTWKCRGNEIQSPVNW
jgi:hypothetical protein